MKIKRKLFTVAMLSLINGHAFGQSEAVGSWEDSSAFGVAVKNVEAGDGVTLNAWCLVSAGAGRVSGKLSTVMAAAPAWAPTLLRNMTARQGDVVCFGRAGPRNTPHRQQLSFSAAWWEAGVERDHHAYQCRGRYQCVKRWGSRMGAHQTTDATDGLSVCIEVTDSNGATLKSITMSNGENLPNAITAAHGKFSDASCAARAAEWRS